MEVTMDLQSNALYKERWISDAIIKLGLPDTDENKTKLSKRFDTSYKPKKIKTSNTYTIRDREVSAMQLFNEVKEHKLILNETGTMFHNQDTIMSPVTETEFALYKDRDVFKALYKYNDSVEGNNPVLAGRYNLLQGAVKTLMNTYYGVQANEYSKFYNPDVAGSITGKCRSVTSVSALAVESIFSFVEMESLSEVYNFVLKVQEEIKLENGTHKDIIQLTSDVQITDDMLVAKLVNQTKNGFRFKKILLNTISAYDYELKVRLFYKSNFNAFISLDKVMESIYAFIKVFDTYNAPFLDPYKLPKEVSSYTGKFEYILELFHLACGGFYNTVRAKEKIDEMTRRLVAIMDTDSNIVILKDPINNLTKNLETLKGRKLNEVITDKDIHLTVMNFISGIMSHSVDRVLKRFAHMFGCQEKYAKELYFKNEYYFETLLITSGKKNYASILALKEGKRIDPTRLEIKGLTMKKTSVNPEIGRRAMDVVENYVLRRPNDFSLKDFVQKVDFYVDEIEQLARQGDQSLYFSTKINTPVDKLTRKDYRGQAVKAWNAVAPKEFQIETPGGFKMVDLKINAKQLKQNYPTIYKDLAKFVEKDKFITVTDKENAIDLAIESNVNRIAIPSDMDITPDFIKEFIDVGAFTSKFIATMVPVLNSFNISIYKGGDREHHTNIINFSDKHGAGTNDDDYDGDDYDGE
jgi:hypothetical protein